MTFSLPLWGRAGVGQAALPPGTLYLPPSQPSPEGERANTQTPESVAMTLSDMMNIGLMQGFAGLSLFAVLLL
ncbi:MAG TPA: hypothetical protein VF555_13055, partial [Variovorax sp.]